MSSAHRPVSLVSVVAHAPFGRTGHESSRVIFGAAALASMRQQRADEILDLLLAYGVDHIDVAASYGDAELRVGAWMPEHRDRFFLATKTGERTADAARAELDRSLERCGPTGSTSSSSTTWSSPASGRWPTAPGARSRRWCGRVTRASCASSA